MARRRTAFAVRTVRWGTERPYRVTPGEAPRGNYDYEGSAREVPDEGRDLPRRSGDGER
jgi:hypothetical protein